MAFSFAQENVLVVVNENSPDSVAIGNYYAARRGVPNICRLRTAVSDTISRDAFDREILQPIADYMRRRSIQDQIWYIVTTRGVPMSIEGTRISVDSELTLAYNYLVTGKCPSSGRLENPYFAVGGNLRPFTRKDFDIYLVTRLTSLDLVDRAVLAETGGDFYFDLASPQQSSELEWVQQAAAELKKAGFRATVETTAKTLDSLIGVQGYVAQSAAQAPLIKWRSGAIAAILDKDAGQSADTYVAGGVTGFGSYTADPMADGFFRPQILFAAYTAGYNLAESYYASSRYLGWRTLVIGDPLAAPYAKSAAAKEPAGDYFAKRRAEYLMQKYRTSREAVELLLQAEAAEARDDRAAALSLAGRALQQDPLLAEATGLRSRLTPPPVEAVSEPPDQPVPAPAPAPVPDMAEPGPQNFPARLASKTPIEYPLDAKQSKIEGDVLVRLLIDEAGQVMKVDVIRGDKRLAKAVVEAVKSWRFDPELQNGRPVIGTYTVPISFKIKN